MAAAFRAVNIEAKKEDATMTPSSPTTPTPTRSTFGQKPLPTSPFPQAVQMPEIVEEPKVPQRENSQHSKRSRGDSEEMDLDDSEGEEHGEEGSDDESVNGDGSRSGKKHKKSQRFYCTDYPPCTLSFTRSEHLARHIRKHTGERPFQCHCSRRFSRLDNLRQHAQTVHVNEDIPIDSLAATGTRFQRQIRTDRVRQPGRARASTAGSMGSAARGHAKSLSTSSISSMGSHYGARDDSSRRRPPPLVMAADPRSRLSLETYHNVGDNGFSYRPVSPSDFSTPTSATFSTAQSSPRWGSAIASPTSSHSRSHSMYNSGTRTPGRRLSVPSSAGIPFQSPHGGPLGRPIFGLGPVNSSNVGAFSSSNVSVASPTSSVFSRRDSISNAADEAWRRRTWHPETSNFNTAANTSSRLSNVITPSQFQSPVAAPLPAMNNPQTPTIRLPGIESFGPIPQQPPTPPRRAPSPMVLDSDSTHPPAMLPGAEAAANEERRSSTVNWDMGLHRGLTRLDITNTTPPRDSAGAWAQEVHQAVEQEAVRGRVNPPVVRFNDNVIVERGNPQPPMVAPRAFHQHTMSAPTSHITSREAKRHGWYHGPVTVHSEARPEKMARVERMVHPNFTEFSGFPAREAVPSQPPTIHENSDEQDKMLRLQALVAVATSENNATTAY